MSSASAQRTRRPGDVGQVGGHVVAVVPELVALRLAIPSRSQVSARSYSTSTDAHDPVIRYARAVCASEAVGTCAVHGTLQCLPSVVHPAREDVARPDRRGRVVLRRPIVDRPCEPPGLLP